MNLAASTTVIARASAVDGRRPAPINATNDASTGRGDVSPSRLVLIFVRSYNRCMLHSTGSGALTHVNVYARVGHHAGSVDIVNRRALVTPSVSIKSDTCGADRRRDPTLKHRIASSLQAWDMMDLRPKHFVYHANWLGRVSPCSPRRRRPKSLEKLPCSRTT